MLLDPRTPVVVGIILIVIIEGFLALHAPMPGYLASAHGQIANLSNLDGCQSCHTKDGFPQGCLGCHEEISDQLENKNGYHHHLLDGKELTCTPCHSEHLGSRFALVNEISWGAQTAAAFKHPHLDFSLNGRHDALACAECHVGQLEESFTLPKFEGIVRNSTFLGLAQECLSCHADVHTEGFTGACDSCHGQEAFRPTTKFDHGQYFPLDGGHETASCGDCHVLPAPGTPARPLPFPFEEVRGTTCEGCHESPHHVKFQGECESCHPVSDTHWTTAAVTMTPERHRVTGFRLIAPHADVSCEQCHPSELSYQKRHPDPTAAGYDRRETTCQGCHTDIHGGQFLARHDQCIDCHDRQRFQPPIFGHVAHDDVYRLVGAHRAVACSSCHQVDSESSVRQFVETPRECKSCHEDPHAGQFQEEIRDGDCVACHDNVGGRFRIRPFDHYKRTGHALEGAHSAAECNGCHVEVPLTVGENTVIARRFVNTPTECSQCHQDVHRGQFTDYKSCLECHTSFDDFNDITFDHNKQSQFPLRGVHATLSCSKCHNSTELEDGNKVVQYRPLRHECRDCHEIPR